MEQNEERLNTLEDHATRTESRLEQVESRQVQHGEILREHGGKLDRIFEAVTKQEARGTFDILRSLQAVALTMAILTPIAALSIWTISIVNAATNEAFRVKFEYVERDMDRIMSRYAWGSNIERGTTP